MHDSKRTKEQLVEEIKTLREKVGSQQALLQSALLPSGVVASAMDGIMVIDDILEFNATAEQIFGHKAAEGIGKPIRMLLPERFRDNQCKRIQTFGETGNTS